MAKHNGWTNWETWNVALWLQNDSPSVLAWATEAAEDNPDALQGFVESDYLSELSGLASDLVTNALAGVNWAEIADALTEE